MGPSMNVPSIKVGPMVDYPLCDVSHSAEAFQDVPK
jgi:hypothetical protein